MPRCAKTKRLTEWLDREQIRLSGGKTNKSFIIAAPRWVVDRIAREGCSIDGWLEQARLPSGKAVRELLSNDTFYVVLYPGTIRIDVSRFMPKDQTGVPGVVGEVRRPTVQAGRRVVRRNVLVEGLSEVGRRAGATPDRVSNAPARRTRNAVRFYTPVEVSELLRLGPRFVR